MSRAFTLIELLVVVAILALLLALLTPSLRRAKDQARTAICRSNLHQQQLAVSNYLAVHRNIFPDHRTDAYHANWSIEDREKERYWATTLLAYGMRKEAYQCPAMVDTRTDYGTTWKWQFDQYYIGYGYNGFFLGIRLYGDCSYAGISTTGYFNAARIVNPSKNLLIGDTNPPWSQSMWWPFSGTPHVEGLNDRHPNGGGIVFNDGHAEVRMADTINPPTSPAATGNLTFLEFWDPLMRK